MERIQLYTNWKILKKNIEAAWQALFLLKKEKRCLIESYSIPAFISLVKLLIMPLEYQKIKKCRLYDLQNILPAE